MTPLAEIRILDVSGNLIHVANARSEADALSAYRQGGTFRHVERGDNRAEIITEAFGLRMHWRWEPGLDPVKLPGLGNS